MIKDILLDTGFDVMIYGGDFVCDESTEQHQELLLIANKGEIRQFPLAGVGIKKWLKDEDATDLLSEVKNEFEKDGMKINRLAIMDGKLTLDAYYK